MNDAMLIFIPPNFQFCLCTIAVMAARFSFAIQGIKKHLNGFSEIVTYSSLAFISLIEVSCMQSNQLWFDLKLDR